ncbi:S-layer homology domain-containing protein [Paenibacillus sp. NPDC058174]|uniref:S-layer homology domain-containing protein n=1 Tax=Paenibacillus sp. NPDC058174 TaxID=3346366 RepID=UPI0036DAFF3B
MTVLVTAGAISPVTGGLREAEAAGEAGPAPVELVGKGSHWSYSAEGIDYSAAMKNPSFDFSNWQLGLAPLGYKEKSGVASNDVGVDPFGLVSTVISYGTDAKKKYPTSYFSKIITIDDVSKFDSYHITLGVDDGLIFYVNGTEIYRVSLPAGDVDYNTFATTGYADPKVYSPDLSAALKAALHNGANLLTVEVHNQSLSSSDLYFDMLMTALPKDETGGGNPEVPGQPEQPGQPEVPEQPGVPGKDIPMLAKNSAWKFLDNGTDQGTAWRAANFDDSAWQSGSAPLGYPVATSTALFGGIKQLISYGPSSSKKYITSYFRTTIDGAGLSDITKIVGQFGVDDGVVLYANGTEVYRFNMPEGEPNYLTLSATTLNDPSTETADLTQALKAVLHEGTNVLAAEVHQRSAGSSDVYWDMQLIGNPQATAPGTPLDPHPTAIALTYKGDPSNTQGFAWYTDPAVTGTQLELAEASKVTGGTLPANDTMSFTGDTMEVYVFQSSADKSAGKKTTYASHKVAAVGLKPGTEYSYRVGDGETGHWSDIRTFKTADPSDNAFTFLYTTDPQGTTEAEYVTWNHTLEQGLAKFPDSRFITITGDLVDNGDIENQWMWLLNKPKNIFAEVPLVPALGNHESKLNNNFWYHFDLPNISYTGAKPDGSVYSFDYGDAHFMVMNTEYNEVNGVDVVYKKQEEWLRAEAAKSDKKWKIVMFHKSPYSVASHTNDSDVLFFRNKLTALFDEIGIDVVLSGHDHTYTKSYPMYGNVPQKDTPTDADGSLLNPKGTMYLVSNAAGDKRYTPKAGPFPFAEKYGQPNKEMFTGVTVTNDKISFDVYTTTENGTTDRYDQFSIKKTQPAPNPVQDAKISKIENGAATLTWSAPAGGRDVTAYRVYENSDQLGPNWSARIQPESGKAAYEYALTGLDATKSYQFVIKALSDKDNSAPIIAQAATDPGNGGGTNPGNGGGTDPGNGGGTNPGNGGGTNPGNGGGTDPGNGGGTNPGNGGGTNPGNGGGTNPGNGGGTNPGNGGGTNPGNGGGTNPGNGGGTPKPVLTDIGSHWAESGIERAIDKGFVNGYADGKFRPDNKTTRAEFITMLARALDLPAAGKNSSFTDQGAIPQWAQETIAKAVELGLIGGYDDGTFRANEQISRAEMAVIIVRAAGLKVEPNASLSFADAGQVPAWAVPYVAAAYKAGYISGVGQNRFAPNASATRAEAVTLILKLLAQSGK